MAHSRYGVDLRGEAMNEPQWLPETLLGRLESGTRDKLLGLGVTQSVAAHSQILREGEVESHIVLLRQAVTKVTAVMADGRQALLAIRISGDIVGEMSALNGTPRSATVTTCGRSVITTIHSGEFRAFLRANSEAAMEVAGIVACHLRWANQRRVDFTSYPVRVRLARVLADIATTYGHRVPSGLVIGVRLTQPELATLCGAAEVTLQKALRNLRQSGIVDTGYRRIIVLDMPALKKAADLSLSGHRGIPHTP